VDGQLQFPSNGSSQVRVLRSQGGASISTQEHNVHASSARSGSQWTFTAPKPRLVECLRDIIDLRVSYATDESMKTSIAKCFRKTGCWYDDPVNHSFVDYSELKINSTGSGKSTKCDLQVPSTTFPTNLESDFLDELGETSNCEDNSDSI